MISPFPPVRRSASLAAGLACGALLFSQSAAASFLSGEALDKAADVIALVVLFIVPVIAVVVFWLVHVLPEKVAEKRHHPQAELIKVICLLSLVFGGLLWPVAWIIAYSKPIFYRMAYGRDRHEEHEGGRAAGERKEVLPGAVAGAAPAAQQAAASEELHELRARLAALEARIAENSSTEGAR